ncbi:MAG: Bug family tripartite tricarboxylate transporter substrate binding protein [Beijerinckiaceae bacterium]|jgi:tripartite-type tricarboxylate transporter receptor subunit TctC
MTKDMRRLLAPAFLTLAAACSGAHAQTPAEFYKGKTLTITVGFSPGGGYDQYARVLARHIGRHTPGAPSVIVQNMPGAGSLTAVRRLEAGMPKDGTAIVTFNPAIITESILEPERVNFKFTDAAFLGSVTRDFRVCFMWHATGAKTWEDAMARKEVIFGSTAKGTGAYVNQAILKNVFGMKARQILGFPGSAEQRLAIERGELDGDCGSWSSVPEEWIRDKKVHTFVSFSPFKTPDMPDGVPFIKDLAKTQEQKDVLEILIASGELGRPFIVSQGVPADRLAALRAAFDATMQDKEFLEENAKQLLPVYPVKGVEAADIVKRIYTFPPDLIAKARAAAD